MPVLELKLKPGSSPTGSLPIDLGEARSHLGLTTQRRDGLVKRAILAAAREIEAKSRLVLSRRSYVAIARRLPRSFEIPKWPFAGLNNDAIKAVDSGGTPQLVDSGLYFVNDYARPARIQLLPGQAWPGPGQDRWDAYQVSFDAGYETPEKIPENIQQALLLFAAHLLENPEAVRETAGGNIVEVPLGFWSLVRGESPTDFGDL